ncbi:MAG: methionine--tRNA ligase [Phycisphaerales bacterium]|nr:methionine--tRNA ligase [Phycisphaerales bacterium]
MPPEPFYITTPIYYVNDRPHIGHCYSTLIADAAARFQRLIRGEPAGGGEGARGEGVAGGHGGVFFLTGTDEHADKVVVSAREHRMTPLEWADRNAAEFERAFEIVGVSNDDFVRTTQPRHIEKVTAYIRKLLKTGDVYLGDYEGWYDPGQEEYVTETAAKEQGYHSSVSGRPLVKRSEKNYFFRLGDYQERLLRHIEANPSFILPEARRNEVLGRLREKLQAIPISRAVTDDEATRWGILMPDDPGHRIYVWIDALFNYLSIVDTPERRRFWPASVHVIGKDILWFHAVIWPCLLMALGEELPRTVYGHSWWIREGRKMSKSLGNFIDLDVMQAYIHRYGLDAVRWFLITQGPLGANDADFAHAKFVEVYNAELANGIGNCASRVGNMIEKYFGGEVPVMPVEPARLSLGEGISTTLEQEASKRVSILDQHVSRLELDNGLRQSVRLVSLVDQYINATQPFKLAKQVEAEPAKKTELAAILWSCAEAIRIAALLALPAMPGKMGELLARWECAPARGVPLAELTRWGGSYSVKPGSKIAKGEALFMRADPAEPAPIAASAQ